MRKKWEKAETLVMSCFCCKSTFYHFLPSFSAIICVFSVQKLLLLLLLLLLLFCVRLQKKGYHRVQHKADRTLSINCTALHRNLISK